MNAVDRIVYSIECLDVDGYEGVVNILRMRTQYEGVLPAFLF